MAPTTNISKTLKYAIENNMNVLLCGQHGVGKTALVKEAFDAAGLTWKYFSASTMDPWVDFIGVPKEKVDPNTNESYLELIRPQDIANDEVEAIFFDELNRSHKKIRNAIMELIQFGSINGKKFRNLKIIWAAINPDDDEEMAYDVERLDPAQIDRFQLKVNIDYKPILSYFKKVYGEPGEAAVKWWQDQKKEVRQLVSPRRLDYAMQVHNSGGDIRYVFTTNEGSVRINSTSFLEYVTRGNPVKDMEDLLKKPEAVQRAFFLNANEMKRCLPDLMAKDKFLKAYAHLLPEEVLMEACDAHKNRGKEKLKIYIASNPSKFTNLEKNILSNPGAYARKVTGSFKKARALRSQDVNTIQAPSNADPNTVYRIGDKDWKAKDLNIAMSVKLAGYGRDEVIEIFDNLGIRCSAGSVTKATTHLLMGVGFTKETLRIKRAKALGVEIINEEEFVNTFVYPTTTSTDSSEVVVRERDGVGHPVKLEIKGAIYDAKSLTYDNMYERTGRKFKMTNEQSLRHRRGEMTRSEAFNEWMQSL